MEFARLPSVVLAKIYSNLSLTEALNASQTCKNWRSGGSYFTAQKIPLIIS